MVSGYVICSERITLPVLTPQMEAMGLVPNMPCGERCEVFREAPAMDFTCPRGHRFIASPAEIERDA